MDSVEIWSRGLLVICATVLGVAYLSLNLKLPEQWQKTLTFLAMLGCYGLASWTLVSLAAKVLK